MLSPLQRIPVLSSSLRSVGYVEIEGVLEAEFHDGAVYRYSAVPPAVWTQLLGAASKGAFFNLHVRAAYECEPVMGTVLDTLLADLEASAVAMHTHGESS